MFVKCGRRIFSKPYGLGGLGLLIGLASGFARRVPRASDPQLAPYLRQQQMRKLLFRESLWDRKRT
jgi:hypothetical protein